MYTIIVAEIDGGIAELPTKERTKEEALQRASVLAASGAALLVQVIAPSGEVVATLAQGAESGAAIIHAPSHTPESA